MQSLHLGFVPRRSKMKSLERQAIILTCRSLTYLSGRKYIIGQLIPYIRPSPTTHSQPGTILYTYIGDCNITKLQSVLSVSSNMKNNEEHYNYAN